MPERKPSVPMSEKPQLPSLSRPVAATEKANPRQTMQRENSVTDIAASHKQSPRDTLQQDSMFS